MPTQPWNLEAKWAALSESLRAEADTRPLGRARDGLLRRADQLDRAIALERSLRSGREEATTFANKVHPGTHHTEGSGSPHKRAVHAK